MCAAKFIKRNDEMIYFDRQFHCVCACGFCTAPQSASYVLETAAQLTRSLLHDTSLQTITKYLLLTQMQLI